MQISLTVVDPRRTGLRRDLVLDAAPDTSLTDVRPLLLDALGTVDDGETLFVDGRALDGDLRLGAPPLVHGALVVVGRASAPGGRATGHVGGFLELHVVGGPDAGKAHVLGPGLHRIGRVGLADIPLDDPDVSRSHAELELGANGVRVRDTHSTNGSRVDGDSLGPDGVALVEGSRVQVGSSTLVLRRPDAVAASTSPTGLGTIDVNRPPRIRPPVEEIVVRMPARPEEPPPARVPLLAMLLPLAIAVPLAFIWSPYALVFAVMSPVMLLGSLISDRRSGRRDHRRALEGYRTSSATADGMLAAALAGDLAARRDESPDAAAVARVAEGPLRRIWERRRADPDALDLRIGTARLPARVRVVAADTADAPTDPALDDAPVTVSLAELGVLGIAGPRRRVLGLARSLLGQVATLHSPRDVACEVLTDGYGVDDDWAWMTWLPHCRPDAAGGIEAPGACRALLGTDHEQVRRRVAALDALVASRLGEGRPDRTWQGPRVVVLLDGAGRLRTVAGLARLLDQGPAVGVTFVCLDAELNALPAECRGTVELGGEVGTRAVVRVTGEAPLADVVTDLTGPGWAARLARAVAPLRDATPPETGHDLPEQIRLREVLGPESCHADDIARTWARCPRSTKALLGVTPAGPLVVDLRVDGPHALVAGTTGSGKSELLRTLVTSLALGNRPDEMVFVLVDYKGGSAFAECARLPHTVGLVTDLDQHLTRRALVSLQAELRRRERLLREQGATDLDEYQRLADSAPEIERIPRLVLVVDEFRVLAEELPDFVSGLVRIAAVGRSLGLHLVLATQRPGGVVTADMRANVNLRIALRVRDTLDSTDVVDAGDATRISERTPGRALLRAGGNPLVAVQTAHVSGTALGAGPAIATACCTTTTTMGGSMDRAAQPLSDNGSTDLHEFVDALREASAKIGAAPVPSPWLPPLPEVVTADDVAAVRDSPATCVTYGVVDLPHLQQREPLTWDLADDGCLAVVGAPRSGRTSTLRSLVAAVSSRWSPAGVGVYVLDGAGAMADLEDLPHVGAVVPRDDADRTARVLRLLLGEVARRGSLPDPTTPEPYLVLLVDGWESLRSAHDDLDGVGLDPVLRLAREGPAVGVLTVLAGDRSVLMGASGAAFSERLVLRMGEPTDAVLAGVPPQDAAGHLPPGRGFRVGSAGVREVHVALLQPTSSWPDGPVPQQIPPMPTRLGLGELPPTRSSSQLTLGVGGEVVQPVLLDSEDDGPCVLVAGHPRSGRSTTLLTLAAALIRSGRPLVVLAPRRSPLSELASVLGRFGVHDAEALRGCLDEAIGSGTPAAVLVDDAELVDGTPVEPVLLDVLARAETSGELCLLAGSSPDLVTRFAGLTVEARKRGVGVLLGPASPLDGDLFGVRVPRRPERRPGRGLLVRRGEMVPVQVALTVGEDCR